jgi:two-component system, cell cycle sensor histidine kinase and response regulator CckA
VNLAVNARDAMAAGGKLTIETVNVRLDGTYTRLHTYVPEGDYVMLAVADTGSGMSDEVRQHLFEPFFTTKQPGKGTGLGLAMVYGAVKQNGGHIEVYSELGQGTTFKVYLPLVAGREEAAPAPPVQRPEGGAEAILLVEDDDLVRQLAVRLLMRLGYTVHAFANGVEALDTIERADHQVRLLITDVVMPKMNGPALAERLRALRPDVRVLFTSGYTANVIVHHGVLKEGIQFLPKPYSLVTLARRIREVLDESSA